MNSQRGITTVVLAVIIVIVLAAGIIGTYAAVSGAKNTTTAISTSVSTVTATSTSTSTATVSVPTTISATSATSSTTGTAGPNSITVQRNAAVSDLDPRDTSTIDIDQNVYQTLTYAEPNGTIVPQLATSWTHNAAYTNWEFTLRQGVTFHDGTAFNSSAVVFSILNTIAYGGGDAPTVWTGVTNVIATGTYTVNITTSMPINIPQVTAAAYSAFIFSPNIQRYSGVANLTSGLHSWFNTPNFHDDGTGPYYIVTSNSSSSLGQVILQAYPSYWGGWKAGQITTVVVKVVTNAVTAIQLAEQGQFQMAGIGGNFQYVPQLLQDGLNVVSPPEFSTIWMLFNTQHQYLNNQLVRQALASAVNYGQLLDQAYYGYGTTFGGINNPSLNYYDSSTPSYLPGGNITLAKQLLKEAGYPGGLNVTWTVTYSTGSPYLGTVAQILQSEWAPLGVNLVIDGLTFTQESIKAGYINGSVAFEPGPLSYASTSSAQDINLLNWVGDTPDPWLVPDQLWAIQSPPYQNDIVQNWAYWQNATFTTLLNQARSDEITNPAQAQTDFNTLDTMFYQAVPGVPLFAENGVWILSPNIHGFVGNPNYGFDYPFYYQMTYT